MVKLLEEIEEKVLKQYCLLLIVEVAVYTSRIVHQSDSLALAIIVATCNCQVSSND